MAWATSSFPDPLSPVISTFASERATRSISALRSIIAGTLADKQVRSDASHASCFSNETRRRGPCVAYDLACAAWLGPWSAFLAKRHARDGQPVVQGSRQRDDRLR